MIEDSEKIKILIVRCHKESSIIPSCIEADTNYCVMYTDSDEEAAAFAKKDDIALILIRIDNKVVNTEDKADHLLHILKSEKSTRHIPVIYMTEDCKENAFIMHALKSGVADVVSETSQIELILLKINVFAELHRYRRTIEKKSENRLRSSEIKYKSLFDTSRDGIVFMSVDGQIEKANHAYCDMLGYTLNELIFMNHSQLTPEKWHEKDMEILNANVLKNDYSGEYRKELIRKDGSVFPVNIRIWLVRDENGTPLRLLKLVRDVTAQSRLENQLRQAQKMESIGTLAGGIAHDFNNILGAIIGYAQLARYSLKDNEPALKDIDHVLTASNRAKDLVKHILGFSRMSEHSMQPVPLHHIVKEALKLIRASLPSTIEIRQEIANYGTAIMADPTEIHQVLMNFCTNSLHAMEKDGGILEVTLQPVPYDSIDLKEHPDLKPGSYIRLVVSDTGCGIDPRHVDRIFDPYFTTKKKGMGTGLGLAVVHGIIKTHGGSVHVKSSIGKGTVMTVLLPRLESEVEKTSTISENLPRGKETILFVDDEKSLVEIEKAMLQRLGYIVISESSSVRAFQSFDKNPEQFDMVITDMTMPEMTGLELARVITEKKPDMPIILCTGYNNKITPEKAKTAGIATLLLKPVEFRELAIEIRNLLDHKKSDPS